jgi:hypothetical protein
MARHSMLPWSQPSCSVEAAQEERGLFNRGASDCMHELQYFNTVPQVPVRMYLPTYVLCTDGATSVPKRVDEIPVDFRDASGEPRWPSLHP